MEVDIKMKKLLILCMVFLSPPVSANCVCRCINGKVQPICSSTMDLPPMCALEICPLSPPSIQPLAPPTLPPLGTSGCQNKQVLNPYSHQYEWKLICQ